MRIDFHSGQTCWRLLVLASNLFNAWIRRSHIPGAVCVKLHHAPSPLKHSGKWMCNQRQWWSIWLGECWGQGEGLLINIQLNYINNIDGWRCVFRFGKPGSLFWHWDELKKLCWQANTVLAVSTLLPAAACNSWEQQQTSPHSHYIVLVTFYFNYFFLFYYFLHILFELFEFFYD